MLQQIKPKNARSKRELAKREPQINEHPKTTLLLRGTSSSSLINDILTDFHALKQPYSIKWNKKNPVHPFEDPTSLEFFSNKNDASLLVFGSHSKKRPHTLTWTRCFGGEILDMLELCVVQETAQTLQQFKGEKCKTGVKPLLSFSGAEFDSPSANAYTLAKNMFTDFFKGADVKDIDVEGLQLMISFFVGEQISEDQKPQIHMRCWRIVTKKSGQKVPRVEVEEIGPRLDFRVGRVRMVEESRWKEALRKAKHTEAKVVKNIETDLVGDKMGRIHLGKQDLKELQTRKMKGLKRNRQQEAEEVDEVIQDDDVDDDGGVSLKRQKLVET